MKFLCFSDLHRDTRAAERLLAASADVDFVIGAGDYATCHEGIHDTLDILCDIEKPTILVPGNGETTEELREATTNWANARVLHGEGCEIDGTLFWGVGGGIPVTPFGSWSYDFDEDQAKNLLLGCPPACVLVVHSPPINTVDCDGSGRIRGSRSIRAAVEEKHPKLVVCGHIHSDWGKQVALGNSQIINAGPQGVVIEIN